MRPVMQETLPLPEIKARLSKIVDRVEGQHARITLSRNGHPAAALIYPEDLEASP
jgi:antitoxin YefM